MKIHELFVPFEDELQLLPSKRVPDPPRIEWKSAFGDLFFRIKGEAPEVLWCDLGYSVSAKRPLTAFKSNQLKQRLSNCWDTRHFYRVVAFREGEDWALLRAGRFLVKSPFQKSPARWKVPIPRFAFAKALQFVSRPLHAYSEIISRDDDEQRWVRTFAALGEQERTLSILTFSNGNFGQWTALARALMSLAAPQLTAEAELSWGMWCVAIDLKAPEKVRLGQNMKLPEEILALIGVLEAHFNPRVELTRWRGVYPNGGNQGIRFSALTVRADLSFHEKIEAAMLWRDFAREVGKEAEVEALLRELMNQTAPG